MPRNGSLKDSSLTARLSQITSAVLQLDEMIVQGMYDVHWYKTMYNVNVTCLRAARIPWRATESVKLIA